MFSGLVEEVGLINKIVKLTEYHQLSIAADKVLENAQIGDSIAINGVCLTVTALDATAFVIQAIPETLARTNLIHLEVNSFVNLERAMLPTTRIGGHLIQGHIDTTCQLLELKKVHEGTIAVFSLPLQYARYFIDKGYVALDGMSVTIAALYDKTFEVAFIPHTIEHTIVQHYRIGQFVNVEVDMVGKYLERFITLGEHTHE